MCDDVRVMFFGFFRSLVRLDAILEPGVILPGFQCGLSYTKVKPERRLSIFSYFKQMCVYSRLILPMSIP